MKNIFTALLFIVFNGAMAQNPYRITFHSSKCFSGYTKYEPHTIVFNPGLSDNACDTLKIDNMVYYVLENGTTGEEVYSGSSKKNLWNYSKDIYLRINKDDGRMMNGKNVDYDFRCLIFIGHNSEGKIANKIMLFNHGSSITYSK